MFFKICPAPAAARAADAASSKFLPSADGSRSPFRELVPSTVESTDSTWGRELAEELFFSSKTELRELVSARLDPKPDVNASDAVRHVYVVLTHFEPTYELKLNAAGALLELWFSRKKTSPARLGRALLATTVVVCGCVSLVCVQMKTLTLFVLVGWMLYKMRELALRSD